MHPSRIFPLKYGSPLELRGKIPIFLQVNLVKTRRTFHLTQSSIYYQIHNLFSRHSLFLLPSKLNQDSRWQFVDHHYRLHKFDPAEWKDFFVQRSCFCFSSFLPPMLIIEYYVYPIVYHSSKKIVPR